MRIRPTLFLSLAGMLLTAAAHAAPITIASFDGSSVSGSLTANQDFFGQSFTTDSGSYSYTDVVVKLYTNHTETTIEDLSPLYLLSSQYGGQPKNLSSSTSGFLAEASYSASGYEFTNVVLLPGTTYYLYSSHSPTDSSLLYSGYSGGTLFNAVHSNDQFVSISGRSFDFTVTGEDITPEPPPLLLLGTALLAATVVVRRRTVRP